MMKKIYSTCFMLVAFGWVAWAQAPAVKWQKAFVTDTAKVIFTADGYLDGVNAVIENMQQLVQLADGNFMGLLGSTKLVKFNAAGDTIFTKKVSALEPAGIYNQLGGIVYTKMIATSDGGVVLLGETSGSLVYYPGPFALYLSKYDNNGNLLWRDEYKGGAYSDVRYAEESAAGVVQAPDGGYVILARSNYLKGNDKSEDPIGWGIDTWLNGEDYWIIKTDEGGLPQWDKTIGGNGDDVAVGIINVPGGGYLISGTSSSPISGYKTEGQKGGTPGYNVDNWIVKIDDTGNVLWDKTIGTGLAESNLIIRNAADGGYILTCNTDAGKDADKADTSFGGGDIWVLKLDSKGTIQWQKTLGGSAIDQANSILQQPDGGYVLGTWSNSPASGNKTTGEFGGYWVDGYWLDIGEAELYWVEGFYQSGGSDVWLVKLSEGGAIVWQKVFGGTGGESYTHLLPASDGGMLMACASTSGISGNRTLASEALFAYNGAEYQGTDNWLVRFDAETLPVNLLTFSGRLQGSNNALLEWKTATEENFSHFELEKSTDLQYYAKVTNVTAKGNNNSYAYTDNIGSGITYYRLKMVDKDGALKYSNIVAITSNGYAAVTIAPNPVAAGAMLTMKLPPAPKNAYWQIIGIDGKLYGTQAISAGATQVKIDTKTLAKGTYVLLYTNGEQREVLRFVKN